MEPLFVLFIIGWFVIEDIDGVCSSFGWLLIVDHSDAVLFSLLRNLNYQLMGDELVMK